MNEQLSNKIQEQIDANQITPLPKWRFLLIRGSFWLLALLSTIIGGFAVATTLFLFVDYHRHGLWTVPHDAVEFLSMVPFVWLIVLALFVVIADISIKRTKKGYQYRLRAVVAVSVLLSIIFGLILNYAGIGKMTHELLNEIPIYNFTTYDSRDAWDRPVRGRLAGVVVSIKDGTNFSVKDFSGRIWQVRLATSDDSFSPEASSTVRMAGIMQASSSLFIARSIHEWEQ